MPKEKRLLEKEPNWREIADEQHQALESALRSMKSNGVKVGCLCPWYEDGKPIGRHGPACFRSFHEEAIDVVKAALRRYEEGRRE